MCFSCSRRELLAGALSAGLGAVASPLGAHAAAADEEELPSYCAVMAASFSAGELISSSGDRQLDRALIAELRNIITLFPIDPGFKYIEDKSPNAFATNKTFVAGTQGTVLLGLNLIRKEIQSSTYGGVAVAGICAHECAHIFQYFSPYEKKLRSTTSRDVELHADFLAGYYMGWRRQFSSDRIAVFARSIFSKGDYAFNDPKHHGTPEQRFDAMKRGYEVGGTSVTFEAAAADAADFVRRL